MGNAVTLTMETGAAYTVTFSDDEQRDMFLTDLDDGVRIAHAEVSTER